MKPSKKSVLVALIEFATACVVYQAYRADQTGKAKTQFWYGVMRGSQRSAAALGRLAIRAEQNYRDDLGS